MTVWLTGRLPFLLIASAVLTAPLAALLLRLYRRAVLRAMARVAGATAPAPAAATEAFAGPALTVHSVDLHVPAPATEPYRRGRQSLRMLGLVHGLASLAYAAVFTAVWMIWVTPDGFILTRMLWIGVVYTWPAVIVLGLVVAMSRGERLAIAAAYWVIMAMVGGYALARNPTLSAGQVVGFWLLINGPATVLLLAFLTRGVRAVGPLVLAFVTAGVAGALLVVEAAGTSDALLYRIAGIGLAAGLSAAWTLVALAGLGFAALAFLGWRVLTRLARRYQRKLLSDQTLLVYAVVLVFAVEQTIQLIFSGWGLVLTGPAAYAAYVAASRTGMRFLVRPTMAARGPTLLLLRVFALGARSQQLFDALATRWLRTGGIALIAGPDLATATVEPHEFLDFVAGKLSRRFVRGGGDLERQLAEIDTTPDRDGRFRTSELFCHADTWQETMRRLAHRCDAVLMDLRSFSPGHAGCQYEIGELLAAVPLERVVFLVDATTDVPFLESTFTALWRTVPGDSPNRRLTDPRALLFTTERATAREVDGLLRLLLAVTPAHEEPGRGEIAARASA